MFRLSTLRPLLQATSPRLYYKNLLTTRTLSTLRPNPSQKPFSKMDWRPGNLWQSSRTYMSERPIVQQEQGFSWQRLAITAAGVTGAVIVVNGLLNRETREDALSPGERGYLNKTFQYTGAGLALTALTARAMFKSGHALRIMAANPWVVLGVGLVGGITSMIGVFFTPPERTYQKHFFWLVFNGFQGATLSPLFFFNPAVLSRAALYTFGIVGALSYVGATAKNDKFLHLGGPLLAGVTVVALSSLAPMALPLGMAGLAAAEAISLYGGLAVFGGLVLYDTQKVLHHGRLVEQGLLKGDVLSESIGLQLDMMNIFIRLVQLLSMNQRRK